MRILLLSQGFKSPTSIDRFKKSHLPKSIISEATKRSCDIQELIWQTVHSLLEILNKVSLDDHHQNSGAANDTPVVHAEDDEDEE